jgi:cytochrome c oxidase assembly protein subunit 15
MRWMHPAATILAFVFVLLLARTGTRPARLVLGLMLAQFILGIADLLLLAPTWMQVVHLLGADIYWVALVVLAAQTVWPATALPLSADPVNQPAAAAA